MWDAESSCLGPNCALLYACTLHPCPPHLTAPAPHHFLHICDPTPVSQEDGYVPVICGLSRTKFADLERAWDAVRHAKRPRVHTFIATSEIHMQYKLRMTREQVGNASGCTCNFKCRSHADRLADPHAVHVAGSRWGQNSAADCGWA